MTATTPERTPAVTPAVAADAVAELYDRVLTALDVLGDDGDGWQAAVPACPGWDVHDLVGHIGGMTTMFSGIAQPEPPDGWTPPDGLNPIDTVTETGKAARRGWTAAQLREELRTARDTWTAQLRAMPDLDAQTVGPTGPMSMADFVQVRLFDLWHHVVDLHQALGLPLDLAEDGVAPAQCYAYVVSRVPWLFGKKAGAPEGAAVSLDLEGAPARTAAVTDGRAGWADASADSRITGPVAAFALLMTGRLDREAAEQAGLRAEGEDAERLLGVRMFT